MIYFNKPKKPNKKKAAVSKFIGAIFLLTGLFVQYFHTDKYQNIYNKKQLIGYKVGDLSGYDFLMESVYISLNCRRFEEKWQIKPEDDDGVEVVYCKEILREAAEKAALISLMSSLLVKDLDSDLIGDYQFHREKASEVDNLKKLITMKQILKGGHPNGDIVLNSILTDENNKSGSKNIYFVIYFIGSFLFLLGYLFEIIGSDE